MLITTPIPNFIGGINQQPASIRQPNEAEDILNAVPSPSSGLIKRPGSNFVAALANGSGVLHNVPSAEAGRMFFHMIERDENERYILSVFENGAVEVYDIDGTRKTVYTDTGGGLGTLSGVAGSRRAMTIGDVTFIANPGTTVAMTASTVAQIPTNYNRAGLLWIRQANYYREHTVELTSASVTSTFNHISRIIDITNAGSTGTNGTYTNVQLTYVSGTEASTYPTATITVSSGKVIKVQILTDGVNWETENIDVKLSALAASIGNVNNFEVNYKSSGAGEMGTDHVAKSLFSGTSGGYIGPVDGIDAHATYGTSTQKDSVIYLQGSADFTVSVKDDFAGEGITYIRDKVSRFEDLPPTAPHGYMVKVEGAPESPFDDYWVKFVADDGVFSRGLWEETAAPGITYVIDPATMPRILIRQSDGTFMLKKADGTTPVSNVPVGANYNGYKWTNRLVGDNDTNPLPTFVGNKILDIVYHQNRLGFMAGENLILSEVSEFFNFFRTTVLDLLDSDPIDVAASTPRIGKITAAIPFNRDLILFTPTSQMVLRGSEVLTPKTISIANVADFDNLSSTCKPIPTANSILFPFTNGTFTGIRELVPNQMLDGSYVANDLTGNVESLIPDDVKSLAATTHDNIAAVVAGGNLFCYRYFNVREDRIQSAWFRFVFPDHGSATQNATVLWAFFIDSTMYVALSRFRTSGTRWITIESVNMGAKEAVDDITGSEWVFHIDMRSSGTGTYDPTTGRTTFTLPKPMTYQAGKTIVMRSSGEILNIVASTAFNVTTQVEGTVEVNGDQSSGKRQLGILYPMTYEMSTIYMRGRAGQSQASIISGRQQLRYLHLQYGDTGYFRVEATIKNGDTYVYPFTGEITGLAVLGSPNITTASAKVPIFSKNDNVTIKIQNDSPLPCKILSGEVEIEYTDRASRYTA